MEFTPTSKELTVPINTPPMKKILSQSEISQTKTKVSDISQTESDVPIAPPRLRRKASTLNVPITKGVDTPLDSPIPSRVSPPPRRPPPEVPLCISSSTKTTGRRHTLSSHETSQFPRQHTERKKPLDPSLSDSLSSLNLQHNPCPARRLNDTTLGNKAVTPPTRSRTRPVPPKNIRKSLISLPVHLINPPTKTFRSHVMIKIQSPRPPPVIRDLTKTTPILRTKPIHHVTSEENKERKYKDIYTIPGTNDVYEPFIIPWYACSNNIVQKANSLEQLVQNDDPSSLSKDNSELQTVSLSIPDDEYYILPNNLTTNDQSDYVSLTQTLREEGE